MSCKDIGLYFGNNGKRIRLPVLVISSNLCMLIRAGDHNSWIMHVNATLRTYTNPITRHAARRWRVIYVCLELRSHSRAMPTLLCYYQRIWLCSIILQKTIHAIFFLVLQIIHLIVSSCPKAKFYHILLHGLNLTNRTRGSLLIQNATDLL